MSWFGRPKRPVTLRVDLLDGVPKELLPGDRLQLTQSGEATIGSGKRFSTSVTYSYTWDGKTLRLECKP